MNETNLIKRNPILAFYLLAFGLAWLGWIPQALYEQGRFPFNSPFFTLLGGGAPTLAAVLILLALKEQDGIPRLFASLFKWRISAWWYLFSFGFWVLATAIALSIGAAFGSKIPPLEKFAWGSLLPIFITMLISNVWEEIGWRGFALPRLQEKLLDWKIVLIMGLLWSLWHLPLMLNPASPMSGLPWYGEVIFSLSLTVIYTWLYQNSRRSLLLVSVFHAMSNTAAFVLLELGVFITSYIYVVSVTTIVALVIVLVYGPQRFAVHRKAAKDEAHRPA